MGLERARASDTAVYERWCGLVCAVSRRGWGSVAIQCHAWGRVHAVRGLRWTGLVQNVTKSVAGIHQHSGGRAKARSVI